MILTIPQNVGIERGIDELHEVAEDGINRLLTTDLGSEARHLLEPASLSGLESRRLHDFVAFRGGEPGCPLDGVFLGGRGAKR